MKKIFYTLALVLVLFSSMVLLTGCKDKAKQEEVVSKWPDLTKYDIPTGKIGTEIEIKDESNQDGYILNYEIDLQGVSKKDIENYCKEFSDKWTKSQIDSRNILIKSESDTQYAVVITLDEENKTAKIVITSIKQ